MTGEGGEGSYNQIFMAGGGREGNKKEEGVNKLAYSTLESTASLVYRPVVSVSVSVTQEGKARGRLSTQSPTLYPIW
jgi:hypothetical protein